MAKIRRPPELQPEPTPDPVITPAPTPITIGAPEGTIPKGKIGGGGPWSLVNRFDPVFVQEGTKHGVDPVMLKSMMIVETGGKNVSDPFGASGVMQIKAGIWGARAKAAGYDLATDNGQIGMAAAMLGGSIPGVRGTTPMERFLYTYYPILNADGSVCWDCKGESGHTPRMYVDDIALYSRLINEAAGVDPEPKPKPLTEAQVLARITGNHPTAEISFGYAQRNIGPNGPVRIYEYGKGHGEGLLDDEYHPGIDIHVPDETPIFAMFGGEVVCAGNNGRSVWGQGCGYFSDDDGGLGNITILTNASALVGGKKRQLKMTYGHMSSATVGVGQRIADGERIGRSGRGGDYPHVHLDVVVDALELNNPRIWNNDGSYHLNDPIPTIINAASGSDQPIPKPLEGFKEWTIPGLGKIKLPESITIETILTPVGVHRPGRKVTMTGSTLHETGNRGASAGARMHSNWQDGCTQGHPDGYVGVSMYVENRLIIIKIPLDENSIHSGDWRNNAHPSMEICVNASRNAEWTEDTAEWIQAAILHSRGQNAKDNLYPHHSSGCPAIINAQGRWPTVEANVDRKIGILKTGGNPDPAVKYAESKPIPKEWDGTDFVRAEDNHRFYALQRVFVTNKVTAARQSADATSPKVRKDLNKGEAFLAHYITEGTGGAMWLVSQFGSRILAADCSPRLGVLIGDKWMGDTPDDWEQEDIILNSSTRGLSAAEVPEDAPALDKQTFMRSD